MEFGTRNSKPERMKSRSYEDAIATMNFHAIAIKEARRETRFRANFEDAQKYWQRTGMTLDDLNKLSVIHVSGTKGKGSTCAMVESILRNLNVKTGFLSSPHITSVTERIRLNGEPISEELFAHYFWQLYDKCDAKKEHEIDLPKERHFATFMAYYIFLKEQVEVAVIEVGLGGLYDSTNIIPNVSTVGISPIGVDHTDLLGNTLRDIAWHKSGIIKPDSNVFSTQQYDECLPIIMQCAQEKNAKLKIVPPFDDYKFQSQNIRNEIASNPTKSLNASLAIQLSYDWIRKNPHKIRNKSICEYLASSDGFDVPINVSDALIKCFWPGRCQVLQFRNITLYIDGAHTIESMDLCVDWFTSVTKSSLQKKLLLFNVTGVRNARSMLESLHSKVPFDEALFTPNVSSLEFELPNFVFAKLAPDRYLQNTEFWSTLPFPNKSTAFPCIADAFEYLNRTYGDEGLTILVTGSLHLVGATLNFIKTQ